MESIVGGSATATTVAPASAEVRLAQALLRCMGRWGLAKTTIEDIAREAGVSRATAYRVFPGGKTAILDAATRVEIRRLVDEVSAAAAATDGLDECVVSIVHRASCFLSQHEAVRFVREHEPVVFEQHLGFDRAEAVLNASADLLVPVLGRFLDPEESRWVGMWLARLVLSHLHTPSTALDPTTEAGARRLVEMFVLPGLSPRTEIPTHRQR